MDAPHCRSVTALRGREAHIETGALHKRLTQHPDLRLRHRFELAQIYASILCKSMPEVETSNAIAVWVLTALRPSAVLG